MTAPLDLVCREVEHRETPVLFSGCHRCQKRGQCEAYRMTREDLRWQADQRAVAELKRRAGEV